MGFKSYIEIAQECTMEPITKIAEKAGIDDKYLEQYGKYKAKIDYNLLKETDKKDGKLILVTAINPTPAGEGKTTTTVGLADGMQRLGKNVMVALREPSLGPVFGVKGGAAGGGYAQVVPMEDINLHFTGDFHAIGAAKVSVAISVMREIICLIPIFWLLSRLGLGWTWWAFPLSETISGEFGLVLYLHQIHRWPDV